MGVCASSGGMFNNYAIVQGVDHVVPVDMYLPGCPPRPEMLMDAILKIHDKIAVEPLGERRREEILRERELVAGPSGRLTGQRGVDEPYEKPADIAKRRRQEFDAYALGQGPRPEEVP
jgi:coenzyme F420-reducing hydrogenase gamma subunit